MTSIANAVLGQLDEPGRTLGFCDDTDLAGTPVPGLAAGLGILCALVLPSESYSLAVSRMSERWQLWIRQSSASVAGLQLADMAAFSIRRYLQKRELLAKDEGKPFDNIALETVAAFADRCVHLLSPAREAEQT